jgi:hypothetical protein
LKKRTKKLLLVGMPTERPSRVNQQIKVFLVLFFKKELLPSFLSFNENTYPGSDQWFA